MKIERFQINPMGVNCYVVYNQGEAVIVDPGAPSETVLSYLEQRELKVVTIINTHGHADHIQGNAWFMEKTGAPLAIHELDEEYLSNPQLHLGSFIQMEVPVVKAQRLLKDGDLIQVGSENLEVLHTPGHTPGGISLYYPGFVLSGDTLFQGSVGRTDFPKGDLAVLKRSVVRLARLPLDTIVYPGHGPSTRVRDEIRDNPFL